MCIGLEAMRAQNVAEFVYLEAGPDVDGTVAFAAYMNLMTQSIMKLS